MRRYLSHGNATAAVAARIFVIKAILHISAAFLVNTVALRVSQYKHNGEGVILEKHVATKLIFLFKCNSSPVVFAIRE